MTASPPAKPEQQNIQQSADDNLGGVFLAASSGGVWLAAFIAGVVSLSLVSIAIFPGNDGQRGIADWLLLILFPILASALLATFVIMFLAPHVECRNEDRADRTSSKRGGAPPERSGERIVLPTRDERRPPFAEWIARELAASEFGSLNVALDGYIENFDLPRHRWENEPGEITNYRLKLAILKDDLLADPRWKEAPELDEYIADLESMLSFHDTAPAVRHEEPIIAG